MMWLELHLLALLFSWLVTASVYVNHHLLVHSCLWSVYIVNCEVH